MRAPVDESFSHELELIYLSRTEDISILPLPRGPENGPIFKGG